MKPIFPSPDPVPGGDESGRAGGVSGRVTGNDRTHVRQVSGNESTVAVYPVAPAPGSPVCPRKSATAAATPFGWVYCG